MSDKTHFHLESLYPDSSEIFSFEYKSVEETKSSCIFILDTNALLIPFNTSAKSFQVIASTLSKLKIDKRLLIPARVAREFGKNRPTKIADVFLKIRQISKSLNSGDFKIDDFPLLESDPNFHLLKENFAKIKDLLKDSRKNLLAIEKGITSWNWNDPISKKYRDIFTKDIVIEMKKEQTQVIADLRHRILHKIAPGYKDAGKDDEGIGDLIIWQTILEIGKDRNADIIFVTNDSKNDWFIKQDNEGLYPKYELFDEYRRETKGKSINIIDFVKFLEITEASEETLKEVKENMFDVKHITPSFRTLMGSNLFIINSSGLDKNALAKKIHTVKQQIDQLHKEQSELKKLQLGESQEDQQNITRLAETEVEFSILYDELSALEREFKSLILTHTQTE